MESWSAIPGVVRLCWKGEKEEREHTSEGDVGELLVVPSTADVGVGAREPDLLEVGLAAGETLPESRTKGVARLVEAEGLECVFDLVRDLGIGEAPCLGLLVEFPESSEDRETY